MIDFENMYQGRLIQINIDIKNAVYKKDWKLLAKLKAEKQNIEERIKKLA